MPMQLTITGNDGLELAVQIHNFVAALQNPQEFIAGVAAKTAEAPAAETKEAEAPKKAKKEKAKEEAKTDAPASKTTLQEAIDRARDIVGDGEDAAVMNKLQDINKRWGIVKVRELPPEKLDSYMAELDKVFPKEAGAKGSMFD